MYAVEFEKEWAEEGNSSSTFVSDAGPVSHLTLLYPMYQVEFTPGFKMTDVLMCN